MNVPDSLTFLYQSIPGWSKNTYRMVPQSLTTALPGTFTTFYLPENQLVDLKSLAIFADLIGIRGNTNQTAPPPVTAGRTNQCVVPLWSSSLIDQVIIQINGSQVDASCLNYNRLAYFLHDFQDGTRVSMNSVNNLSSVLDPTSVIGTPNPPMVGQEFTGTSIRGLLESAPANSEIMLDSTAVNAWPVCFNNFRGTFLDMGKVIDTSLLGKVEVIIRWATGDVLMSEALSSPTPAQPSINNLRYELQNLRGLISVCDIDPLYYQAMSARLESGPITMNYKRHISFQSGVIGGSGSVRWSVSSQSLDAIYAWGVYPKGANSTYAPNGNDPLPGFYFRRSASDIGLPSSGEGFITTTQVSVNSTLYPMFAATVAEQFYLVCDAFDLFDSMVSKNSVRPDMSLANWYFNFYAFAYRWSHCSSLEFKSGIDTRGLQINGQVNYVINGSQGPYNQQSLIFIECTASLQVGAFRSVSVVY